MLIFNKLQTLLEECSILMLEEESQAIKHKSNQSHLLNGTA
jgi:hypothetical protein